MTVSKALDDGAFLCRGTGRVRRHSAGGRDETAVSGRFTMRPIRSDEAAAPPTG
ncbi:MAG: hypothetical protein ACYS0J_10700 [Planctomycetota bacterium]